MNEFFSSFSRPASRAVSAASRKRLAGEPAKFGITDCQGPTELATATLSVDGILPPGTIVSMLRTARFNS